MIDRPTVSVIIPVYNGERYLGEAIESVLGQTEPPSEILVIDDGSTDGTAAVAMKFGQSVGFFSQANQGAASARNAGIGRSKGAFIALLDADDLWNRDKLRLQLAEFRSHPELDMVFCHLDEFRSPNATPFDGSSHVLRIDVAAVCPSAILAKRTVFESVGPFSTEFRVGEFIEWYGRASDCGVRSTTLRQSLLKRRIHDSNQGVTKQSDYKTDYLRILKEKLDRRRKSGNTDMS